AAIAQIGPPPPPPLTPLVAPPVPPGNPITAAKTLLGKALFWDEQLSSTRTVACGSCHMAEVGGTDPRSVANSASAVAPGFDALFTTGDDITASPGVPLADAAGNYQWSTAYGLQPQVTGRRTQSHINAGYAPDLFWDGRAHSVFLDPVTGDTLLRLNAALESQAAGPPTSSVEMGHVGRDWNDVAARVASCRPLAQAPFVPTALASWINGRTYPQLFAEAFGSPVVTPARIAMAIATYERTLWSGQAPIDSVAAGTAVLRPDEAAGRALFGGLGCAGCHAGNQFTDNIYHYIGVRPAAEDSGRFLIVRNPGLIGSFKTPSLRNVGLRPAFMHHGQFHSLRDVVEFYNRGGDFNEPNKAPGIVPRGLTELQKDQLVAFLGRPLTDPRVAAGSDPFDRPSLFSETELVPRVIGGGSPGSGGAIAQPVALEPPLTGNPDFTVGVFGAFGGASATLVINAVEPPVGAGIPASGSLARLTTTLAGSGAGGGFGSVTFAIPDDVSLQGQTVYGRWYVSDPGASGGVAASAAFQMKLFGPGGAGTLAVDGGGVFTPASGGPRLFASMPNPFRNAASTQIRYELNLPTSVRLVLYDAAGRVVRKLVDQPLQMGGAYSVTWDGRDERGNTAPEGLYFYRLEAGGVAKTNRVVKL
ncbi:MAG: T9SS type A sorting domain-containing protein, partial [Candidatus Eisenbacteria bacterium]|nr:T9SS type A sorting domain-containing protein [Candidatus Eisenbacteria bacterium]